MSFRHDFDRTVLREYDIRGVVGRTLHPADAYAIGRVFGSIVARGGTLPTDGAIMVTGSHNPPDYNGFKMMLGRKPFYGAAITALGQAAAVGDVVEEASGEQAAQDVAGDYVARLLADWDGGDRMLKVIWDNGNGAAGEVLQRLVAGLPGEHIVLNGEIDGRFPAHHPDPTVPRNLQQLIAAVRAEAADIGVAFDGDADRIGCVDDTGEILFGDQLLVVLARDVLAAHPGATIIADVKASQVLFDEVKVAGGVPLMWKTGHSLIKAKMAETSAPLAGEMSGHIFFADKWFGFDDALYAAVRLLGIVARMDGTLSGVRRALPQVLNTPELRFECDEARKFKVIEEVAARLKAAGAQVSLTDGARRGDHAGGAGATEGNPGGAAASVRPGGAGFLRRARRALARSAIRPSMFPLWVRPATCMS